MIFELHCMKCDQVDRVKYERVLKFPNVNEQKGCPPVIAHLHIFHTK
jgi:hypothetical protein